MIYRVLAILLYKLIGLIEESVENPCYSTSIVIIFLLPFFI